MSASERGSVREDVVRVVLEGAAQDERAKLATDLNLTICWANAAARHLLALDPALLVQGGVLTGETSQAQRELDALVAQSAAGPAETVVRFVRQRGCYLLRARRVGEEEAWLYIDLSADHASTSVRYFDFSVVFGLTATEKKTALLILSGLSAAEIAQHSSVALDTVRSHIRAIYSKMGVASREQFFARSGAIRII